MYVQSHNNSKQRCIFFETLCIFLNKLNNMKKMQKSLSSKDNQFKASNSHSKHD